MSTTYALKHGPRVVPALFASEEAAQRIVQHLQPGWSVVAVCRRCLAPLDGHGDCCRGPA